MLNWDCTARSSLDTLKCEPTPKTFLAAPLFGGASACIMRQLQPMNGAKYDTRPRNCNCHHLALTAIGTPVKRLSIMATLPLRAPVKVDRFLTGSPLQVIQYPRLFISSNTANTKELFLTGGLLIRRELAGMISQLPSLIIKCRNCSCSAMWPNDLATA